MIMMQKMVVCRERERKALKMNSSESATILAKAIKYAY